jgi:short-subunit dehydrogenase
LHLVSLPGPSTDATVVVTGASAGIGAELARQLAAKGHNVSLVARRRPQLNELAKELRELGVEADVHVCNLASDRARANLITKLREGDRRVAGVCNNAGFGTFGLFQDLDQERELEEVRLNVLALQELTGAFVPDMVKQGSGAILNVASIAAFQPIPANATYGATKAFVLSFSEAVHQDLAGTGVSCSVLCPGPVRTEFTEVSGIQETETTTPDFVWETADDVARVGIEAMEKGRRTVFPALTHRAIATGGRFAPRSLLLPLAGKFGFSRVAGES